MLNLKPPRHTPTLPIPPRKSRFCARRLISADSSRQGIWERRTQQNRSVRRIPKEFFSSGKRQAHPDRVPAGGSSSWLDRRAVAPTEGRARRYLTASQWTPNILRHAARVISGAAASSFDCVPPCKRKRWQIRLSASRRPPSSRPPCRPRCGGPKRGPCPGPPAPPWRTVRRKRNRRRSSCRIG